MGPPAAIIALLRHSGPCSPYTTARGHGTWCRAALVAVVGLVGLVWVVFALVALALVAGFDAPGAITSLLAAIHAR